MKALGTLGVIGIALFGMCLGLLQMFGVVRPAWWEWGGLVMGVVFFGGMSASGDETETQHFSETHFNTTKVMAEKIAQRKHGLAPNLQPTMEQQVAATRRKKFENYEEWLAKG